MEPEVSYNQNEESNSIENVEESPKMIQDTRGPAPSSSRVHSNTEWRQGNTRKKKEPNDLDTFGETSSDRRDTPARKTRVVETVIFLPYTKDSELMKRLKASDDMLTKHTGVPDIRFVERAGRTLMDLLGRSNPWASDQSCQRHNCLPCWTKGWMKDEADKQPIVLVLYCDR